MSSPAPPFMEFDVCFFRARGVFQLQPAATP